MSNGRACPRSRYSLRGEHSKNYTLRETFLFDAKEIKNNNTGK